MGIDGYSCEWWGVSQLIFGEEQPKLVFLKQNLVFLKQATIYIQVCVYRIR